MRVAVLGLGRMGSAVAERVERAGRPLVVWNRTAAATEPFAARGAQVVATPAMAWRHADVCITMLADSRAVLDVTLGSDGLLAAEAPEGALVDMSTIDATTSATVAAAAERASVSFLRAPVSGNPAVVAAGNLAIIVSGPRDEFERLRAVLAEIGPNLFHVGAGEQARVVKLAVNLLLAGTAELLAEALLLGEAHGIERRDLLEVIAGSAVGSPFVRYKTPGLVADDYRSTFTTQLLEKDLGLALEAAAAEAVQLPLTQLTRELAQACIDAGMGDLDLMAFLPRLRAEAGLDTRDGG